MSPSEQPDMKMNQSLEDQLSDAYETIERQRDRIEQLELEVAGFLKDHPVAPASQPTSTESILWSIKPALDLAAQVVTLDINTKMKGMTDTVTREIYRVKDEAVRRALIRMGWTPPNVEPSPSADTQSKGEV